MPQRKCATCRYFLPSGANNCGQCSHPTRQALFGLVMVRAQELACRRGPNDDDWAAPSQASESAAAFRGPASADRPALVQPMTAEARREPAAEREQAPALTDMVVVAEEERVANGRQRQGFQGVAVAVQSMELAGAPTRRELNTDGIPIVRKRATQVSEAHRAVQERRERELRRRRQLAMQADEQETPSSAAPANGEADHSLHRSEQASSDRSAGELRSRPVAGGGGGAPPAHADLPEGRQQTAQYPTPRDSEPVSLEAAGPQAGGALATPAAAPAGSDLLISWEEEWRRERMAECPERRCATCRDYRVSDNPERGWCGNPFAHSHRQLVQADDLACLSAVGNWWTESDQRWLDKVGPSASAPTPLADGLIQLLKMKRVAR